MPVLADRVTTETSYDTCWIATHKNGCTAAAFSSDGTLVATGSQDTTIKLIDVNKIRQARIRGEEQGVKAVIKTLYDHTHKISALDFHPSSPILGSASDVSIKFYDLRETAKRIKREMKDTHAVRALKFHPSGDYLLVGSEHHFLRLYDCSSRNSYVSNDTEMNNQHQQRINSVDTTMDGRAFLTSSDDGTIKLWDGRTLSATSTYSAAHGGTPVIAARFSRNGKYVLSTGGDRVVRLWDVAAGKTVSLFHTPKSVYPCPAAFTFDERHIIVPDAANGLLVFDTLTQVETQHLYGHTNGIHALVSNFTDSLFVSCSEDARVRFWSNAAAP